MQAKGQAILGDLQCSFGIDCLGRSLGWADRCNHARIPLEQQHRRFLLQSLLTYSSSSRSHCSSRSGQSGGCSTSIKYSTYCFQATIFMLAYNCDITSSDSCFLLTDDTKGQYTNFTKRCPKACWRSRVADNDAYIYALQPLCQEWPKNLVLSAMSLYPSQLKQKAAPRTWSHVGSSAINRGYGRCQTSIPILMMYNMQNSIE